MKMALKTNGNSKIISVNFDIFVDLWINEAHLWKYK
jgi:hypothetical protein